MTDALYALALAEGAHMNATKLTVAIAITCAAFLSACTPATPSGTPERTRPPATATRAEATIAPSVPPAAASVELTVTPARIPTAMATGAATALPPTPTAALAALHATFVYRTATDTFTDNPACLRPAGERRAVDYSGVAKTAAAAGWLALPTTALPPNHPSSYYMDADVRLSVVHVADCQRHAVASLLSPALQQQLLAGDPPSALFAIRSNLPGQWSPDGRMLAFVAAPEGNAAQLYAYELASGKLLRLTSGVNHVLNFWWSPDSRSLVAQRGFPSRPHYDATLESVDVVSADGSGSRTLYAWQGQPGYDRFDAWLSSDTFVGYGYLAPAVYGLHAVYIANGRVARLADDYSEDVAADPRSGTVAYAVREDSGKGIPGVYYVSPGSAPRRVYSGGVRSLQWSAPLGRFVFETTADGVLAMAPDGKPVAFADETIYGTWAMAIARDGSAVAFGDVTDAAVKTRGAAAGIRVYAPDGTKRTEWRAGKGIVRLVFSPDGRTLAFTLNEARPGYYVLRAGEPHPEHVDLPDALRTFDWVVTD